MYNFKLDGNSATHDGSATTALYTNWPDNSRISLGTSHDLTFKHVSDNSYITNALGHLYITQNADNSNIIFKADNGAGGAAEYFLLDGSAATHDGSATTGLYTNWPDKSIISLGASHDLQIHHDGSNSYISQNVTGELYIENNATDGDVIL